MQEERAQDIFNKIKSEGIKVIDYYIKSRKEEELFLDFKRSANDGKSTILEQTDRNNLAKAISGFANSEGGIIIWGVDCSKDFSGADVAKAKKPIKNIDRFVSLLQGAISGCTIPPHTKVENYSIKGKRKSEGYAVTFIPKSDTAPHQTVYNNQYYIRAGSNFVPTPHAVLAGMFGRRPQPWVYLTFTVGPAELRNIPSQQKEILCQVGLVIYNGGRGIARDIFLNVEIHGSPGKQCKIWFDMPDQVNWMGGMAFGFKLGIISKNDFRIAPNSLSQPIVVNMSLIPPFDKGAELRLKCGCEGSAPFDMICSSSKEVIEKNYEAILKSSDIKDTQHYVSLLFGLPYQEH